MALQADFFATLGGEAGPGYDGMRRAGADGVVDARLEYVGPGAAISFLPPADVVGAVFPDQTVPAVRRAVIVDVAPLPVAHCADLSREGASHAAAAIARVDGGMARLA